MFAFVRDPVGLGIVESFSHPGGDFTGVTYGEAGLGGKRLELLIDAIAGMTRAAVLWSSSFSGNAADLGEHPHIGFNARNSFSRKLNGVRRYASESSSGDLHDRRRLFGQRKLVAELALTHGFPMIHSFLAEV